MIILGIDGGGSNLRAAAVDDALTVLAQAGRGTANPSSIGREASAALIQDAIREVIAALPAAEPIHAVGIGVAGASPEYADAWLRATVAAALPDTPVATGSDIEIALVGAHSARRGVIVVAGTGSVAFGVNEAEQAAIGGGWGYMLGDEGGGYWLVIEALKCLTRWSDGIDPAGEALAQRFMAHLNLSRTHELIPWLYRQPPPIREVAALSGVVLEAADAGDPEAARIVEAGAEALKALVEALIRRLEMHNPPIAFGGGLLTTDNRLSRALASRLDLPEIPHARHPPVIGAALLAKLTYH